MTGYEYKVVPAPAKGRKGPGVKGPEARFAHGLQELMNEMGAAGWEYQRADILPSTERQGLTSSQTVYRSVLVFRRLRAEDETAPLAVSDETDMTPKGAADDDVTGDDKGHVLDSFDGGEDDWSETGADDIAPEPKDSEHAETERST